jgi:hypothetical protein
MAMTTTSQNPVSMHYRLTMVMLVLFFLWLALSYAGVTRNVEGAIAKSLPAWSVRANLLLVPFLWAIAAGSFRISFPTRLLCFALALCSLLILVISFRRYLWPSVAVLSLFLLEVYWIIPKWNSRWRETGGRAE